MPSPETVAVFIGAVVLFAVVPGPAVIYVVTRSADQGRAAGLVSVLGIATGNLVHVLAAAVGLSALLASSAVAFSAVKYLGAAYLVFLGVRKLLQREEDPEIMGEAGAQGLSRSYSHGVVVATLNPKTALFFLAFLPQFVDAGGSGALQIGLLGVLLVVVTAVSDSLYALVASRAGSWVRGDARFARRRRVITGTVYVGLGVAAALTGPQTGGDQRS